MPAFFQDLKFSLRMLAQSLGFSATAIVTLALGLGAATTIFTVVNSVLLRPLPYPHPERLVVVSSVYQGSADYSVTRAAQFRFLQEQNHSFESLEANDVVPSGVNLSGGSEPEQVMSSFVSAEFFRVLGVIPAVGRTFTPEEDRSGGGCVAVLTDGLWRTRYDGDRSIVGGSILVNGESCAVVGVLPPSFRFHLDAQMFMPIRIAAAPRDLGHYYSLLGRLKPGVTLEQARTELQALFSGFKATHGDLVDEGETGFQVARYQDAVVGNVRPALWVLLSSVFLLLLIACANVANLLISRAAVRSKEMAVRAALGAGRWRLARQLITESALLAFAGAAGGLLIAYLGIPVLLHLSPSGLPRAADISVDVRVVAFAFLMSAATVLVFGVAPAMFASRVDLNVALKTASNRAATGASRRLSRSIFIGTEVALSVVLLTGAVLLTRSFVALQRVAPGFDPRNVLTFKMSIPARYSTTTRMWEFEREVLARLDALPGVEGAASATCLPLENGPDMPTAVLGQRPVVVNPAYRPVSADYFRVLGIPLVRGRFFVDSDSLGTLPVAVINAAFARQNFQGRDPIGQRLQLGAGLGQDYADAPRLIVGVVGDVRETSLDKPAEITVFIPRAQIPERETLLINRLLPMSWAVRTRIPPAQLADAIRHAVLSVDPQQPAAAMRTMEQVLSIAVDRQRFTLLLMTIFASLAMLMAAVGIYGVVSYQVRQRERELGIRLALGAAPRSLVHMVTMREIGPIAAGVTAGVLGSLALAKFIRSLLFETSPNDPVALAASALALGVLAWVGCYWPARRASLVDPMQILRDE
jgi:putative ABC transport system permease protein